MGGTIPVTRVDPAKDQVTREWLEGSKNLQKKLNLPSRRTSNAHTPGEEDGASSSPDALPNSQKLPVHPSGPHGSTLIESDLYLGGLLNEKQYDPEAMAGLPVGIQIVGKLFEDEKVLEIMQIIDDLLGERGFGPGSSGRYL